MSKNGQAQETPEEKPKAAPARPAAEEGQAARQSPGQGPGPEPGKVFGWRLLKWASVAAIWCLFIGLCFVAWLAYDLPDLPA